MAAPKSVLYGHMDPSSYSSSMGISGPTPASLLLWLPHGFLDRFYMGSFNGTTRVLHLKKEIPLEKVTPYFDDPTPPSTDTYISVAPYSSGRKLNMGVP